MGSSKFGVYVPEDLMNELTKCMQVLGIKSRSVAVREALNLFILEHKWRYGGKVVGVLGLIYDHEVNDVDEALTDIQHKYLQNVISALHVHLSERECMLLLAVKGEASEIKNLLSELMNLKGVKLVRPLLLSTEK